MKLLRSFVFAFAGIRSAFGSELNFRIHTVAAILALCLSAVLKISTTEWILVFFCIAFVLVVELLNTALEKLSDVVHPDIHPGIKKVKDIAAGAVLIAALFSIATGMIIFVPKIIAVAS
jgi:diacylglycerol kinase